MSQNDAEILVGDVECGLSFSEKHAISFSFRNFVDLPCQRGDLVESPTLRCHGYDWSIDLYPGGENNCNGNLSVYLRLHNAPQGTTVKWSLVAGNRRCSGTSKVSANSRWGAACSFSRTNACSSLAAGAFVIKATIQVSVNRTAPWSPKVKPQPQLQLLEMLDSGKWSADATFIVGDREFSVHRSVLSTRAPILEAMAEDANGESIEISGVDPDVFRAFLRFVYGNELPAPLVSEDKALSLLEIADRFGCLQLKLVMESEVVSSILSPHNAAEWLLIAESHSCALLKERAVAAFVYHTNAVMESDSWSAVEESAPLMAELMKAAFNKVPSQSDGSDIDCMDVSTLRKNLDEKGLDVDGTREMLIQRLKNETQV